MTIEEIKTELKKMVLGFATKVQPVYELLGWEWSPGKEKPHIPSAGEIENVLYSLIEHLREGEDNWSQGGLSAYFSMPSAEEPGHYGLAFELEEEKHFD